MDVQWTTDNIEEQARVALGSELALAAELFPRVVNATYVQMMNSADPKSNGFSDSEYRKSVCAQLPTTVEETAPFFVRQVWNRKWNFETSEANIRALASEYTKLMKSAGHQVSTEELVEACRSAFSGQ